MLNFDTVDDDAADLDADECSDNGGGISSFESVDSGTSTVEFGDLCGC